MKHVLNIIMAIMIVGCNLGLPTRNISDVTKSEKIILYKSSLEEHVSSMKLVVQGHINGKAKIVLMLNNSPYKTEIISGNVNVRWGGEWYQDEMIIYYDPIFVTDGQISLRYNFKD